MAGGLRVGILGLGVGERQMWLQGASFWRPRVRPLRSGKGCQPEPIRRLISGTLSLKQLALLHTNEREGRQREREREREQETKRAY